MAELSRTLPAEDRLVLLPKNPAAFFAFWQFSEGRAEAFSSAAFGPEVEVRVTYSEDKSQAGAQRADWRAGRIYVAVPARGGSCEASLYGLRNGAWEKLLESNQASTPEPAGNPDERAYASMEFMKRSST